MNGDASTCPGKSPVPATSPLGAAGSPNHFMMLCCSSISHVLFFFLGTEVQYLVADPCNVSLSLGSQNRMLKPCRVCLLGGTLIPNRDVHS